MKVLTSAGMVTRSACGSTTSIIAGQNRRPRLAAASCCALRDGLQAGAHHFGQIGRDHQHQRDLGPQQFVDR